MSELTETEYWLTQATVVTILNAISEVLLTYLCMWLAIMLYGAFKKRTKGKTHDHDSKKSSLVAKYDGFIDDNGGGTGDGYHTDVRSEADAKADHAWLFSIPGDPIPYDRKHDLIIRLEAARPSIVSGVNLQERLDRYYEEYVNIDALTMCYAQLVADTVAGLLHDHLWKTWPEMHIKTLKQVGSIIEGLKVVEPDEFDFMIPVELDPSNWKVVDATNTHGTPGFCTIRKTDHSSLTPFDGYMKHSHLSPSTVRSVFQGALQRMINNTRSEYPGYVIKAKVKGPSVSLTVEYSPLILCGQKKTMCIDFVPTFSIRNRSGRKVIAVVAKPHPLSLQGAQGYDTLWRQSFSSEEAVALLGVEERQAKCLKILKAVRLHDKQLGMLNSYTLKTVLLHKMRRERHQEWYDREFNELFVDFVKVLVIYLERCYLPHYFIPEVDLFAEHDTKSLFNLQNYLKKRIDALDTLL